MQSLPVPVTTSRLRLFVPFSQGDAEHGVHAVHCVLWKGQRLAGLVVVVLVSVVVDNVVLFGVVEVAVAVVEAIVVIVAHSVVQI